MIRKTHEDFRKPFNWQMVAALATILIAIVYAAVEIGKLDVSILSLDQRVRELTLREDSVRAANILRDQQQAERLDNTIAELQRLEKAIKSK